MTYSYVGLSKPIAVFNNMLKEKISEFKKSHRGCALPLEGGGVFSSNLSSAAKFAGENEMCVYLNLEELISKSDIIFIFLSDESVKNISLSLGKSFAKGKIFCHFSLCHMSDVLDFNSSNTYLSLFFPYYTKTEKSKTSANLIIAEGYGKKTDELKNICLSLNINYRFITGEEKLTYLTGVNFIKEFTEILRLVSQKLIGYSFASTKGTDEGIIKLLKENPHLLNSYDALEKSDAVFLQKQSDLIKSLGIKEYTDIFSSFLETSLFLSRSESKESDKIKNIAYRNLKEK